MAVRLGSGPVAAPTAQPRLPRGASRALVLAPALAGLWSLSYLGLGGAWLLGAPGNPAEPAVDGVPAGVSVLRMLGPQHGAALLAGLGGLGLLLSLVLVVVRPAPGPVTALRRLPTVLAGSLGLLLAVVLPDFRLLAATAYTPIVLVLKAVGGLPDDVQVWSWPVTNLGLLTLGGVAWLATAVLHHRRIAGACGRCGSQDQAAHWTTPEAAARWGRWATVVAVLVPLGYAVTRFAWALGIPLGVSREFLDDMGPNVYFGAGLGALAVGGAILTLGLVQRWGEVFPRWMVGLRGRRVPMSLVLVPAGTVSVVVGSAGLMFVRFVFDGSFGETFPGTQADIATWLPEMFWPVWAVALAAAAYAYWLRRRTTCRDCGRGPAAASTAR